MPYPICKSSVSSIRVATIVLAITAALVASGCATAPEPLPLTRAEDRATSPVIREALPHPVIPAPVAATTSMPNPEVSAKPPVQGSTSAEGPTDAMATAPAGSSASSASPASPATSTTSTISGQAAPASTASTTAKTSPSAALGRTTTKDAARRGAKNAPKAAASAAPTLASAMPSAAATSVASASVAAQPGVIPPGTLFVCSASVNGATQQTAIEFEPRVKTMCARHPEMGVCQYERELCRAAGGRVYTPGGDEITKQTEAEYDKKVLRVRFKAG